MLCHATAEASRPIGQAPCTGFSNPHPDVSASNATIDTPCLHVCTKQTPWRTCRPPHRRGGHQATTSTAYHLTRLAESPTLLLRVLCSRSRTLIIIYSMPTWQDKRAEAARRAELFGAECGESGIENSDGSGLGTRASANGGFSSARRYHRQESPSDPQGDLASSSSRTMATWTRPMTNSGVAGRRPGGYFDTRNGGSVDNRNSVDSQTQNASCSATFVQKRMVHRAIQQHQGTTASAERSLAVAESCLDIGVTTLEEVARQGESLDKTERGLDMVRVCVYECMSVCLSLSLSLSLSLFFSRSLDYISRRPRRDMTTCIVRLKQQNRTRVQPTKYPPSH